MNLILAYIGLGLMVVLTGIGSSVGVTICGNTVVGAMKKNPDAMGTYIALSALPSSQGLYGFVGFFLANSLIGKLVAQNVFDGPMGAIAGWGIFAAGLALGVVGLFSAIRQAQVCANGVQAIGGGHNVFGATMVMAVFPELYAILALLVSILIFNAVPVMVGM
ncbi:ATPase [Porphyromonas crevioricanis]|uniref:ATPase n=2 Tax=Porphyromonas crevioricanis TaxID=393921 RepID=A0A0A2FI42_9PORP|nr:V-type ATP synthase subunit K [Porphyromonas crevioricanis]KGN90741.1 ATPase [Porphyromonas crevioricanis]KGN94015.1 ATPase [Porphyromonas crevioricanis]SJZ61964.1 V/A-type H+-transporting ATPase subunit K [Porphyromonas crevioricanis]SQH72848.1 Sodium ATPase proteolipid component [Porphyromonas crevioricanis]GAD06053.1 V-type ATP synthase subunit K [Porphyromonas crevioricanis JCM 15906]